MCAYVSGQRDRLSLIYGNPEKLLGKMAYGDGPGGCAIKLKQMLYCQADDRT